MIDFSKLHAIGKPTAASKPQHSGAGTWNRPGCDSWDERLLQIIAEHFPGEEYGGEYGAKEHDMNRRNMNR
ncbi:hypothetical protein AGMMS50276_29510 [Synergistales bacterium]|nr:hypothetical protein AGMMS50276_29510 [Synergistales bacterium]